MSGEWLASLSAEAFPVVIDPTFNPTTWASQLTSFPSTGGSVLNVARAGVTTGLQTWRSTASLPIPTPPTGSGQPWKLTSAFLSVVDQPGTQTGYPSLQVLGHALQPMSFGSVVDGGQFLPTTGVTSAGPGLYSYTVDVASWIAAHPGSTAWFGFIADENLSHASTYEVLTGGLSVEYFYAQTPAPTSLSAPAGTISTTTPLLQAIPVTGENTTVYYRYVVSTEQYGAGQVLDSGWVTSSSFQVPDGALADGMTYYARVWAAIGTPWGSPGDYFYVPPANPSITTTLTIKKRLGGGGPAPTDTVGAVPGSTATPSEGAPSPGVGPASVTVNMVTGNLAVAVNTHPLSTLAGAAGVALNYDSLGANGLDGSAHGLYARYSTGSTVLGQRVDPNVNFSWTNSPMGGYTTGPITVEWTGTVTKPNTTGAWHLGGTVRSGTMSIYVDGSSTAYRTVTQTTPLFGAALTSWVPGSVHDIRITYTSTTLRGVQLWAYDDGLTSAQSSVVVPTNMLTPRATGLPAGWRLSANPYSGSWTRLDDLGTQVVLHSSTGATATFTRRTDGTYSPPPGSTDLLTVATATVSGLMNAGEFTISSGTMQMIFGSDGWVKSVTTLADDLHPTALEYTYTTLSGTVSTPVLSKIKDRVTNRSIYLCYGTSACTGGGSSAAPDGLLGRINYWDATNTILTYVNGQLTRITNPGGITADLGYDSSGRLISLRDPLAYDAIAAGQRSDCPAASSSTPTCSTHITFDTASKVATVTQPAPTPGATRTTRTYTTLTSTTAKVQITGFSPSSGYASWVRWDGQGRIVEQKDAKGRSTTTIWDPNIDRPLVAINPTGLQTTNVYDSFTQYLTDQYGPAPSNCFSASAPYTPTGSCSVTMPRTQHRYDEGTQSLAATFWDNPYFAGPPKLHSTGPGGTGPSGPGCTANTMCTQWNTLPVTPSGITRPSSVPSHVFTWGARLTGIIDVAEANILLPVTTQRVLLYIDGQLYADVDTPYANCEGWMDYGQWEVGPCNIPPMIPAGKHRIQIDFLGAGTQTLNGIWLMWNPFLANAILSPDYGLETSTVDPDGKTVSTSHSDPTAGIGPELGLVTSVTQDPGGLALTSTTSYEAPSSGRWLRKTATTLPAGTTTGYTHYCSTNTVSPSDCDAGFVGAVASACGVTANASQWGLVAQQTDPAPNPSTAPRVQQFVYDPLGRIVGRRVGPSNAFGPWQCTSYDNRGRTISQTYPALGSAAARTVTYTYSVGGNPLGTSVADYDSTVTSTVDLLGRIVEYTDGVGRVTTYAYDSTGRVTSTATGAAQVVQTYDANSSQLSTVEVKINGAVQASAAISYESTTGRTSGVAYNGGQMYLSVAYDGYGNQSGMWFEQNATPDPVRIVGSTITRSPGGRQIDSYVETGNWNLIDPNPSGNNYTYDGAGRLATAYVAGGWFDYSYANNPTGDNCATLVTGANIQAGKNTNRTAATWHTTTGPATSTHSCYNTADQLKATITDGGTPNTTFNYDTRGNQTLDGPDSYTWDSADRLAGITNATTTVTYLRDALDRPFYRAVNGSGNFYGYNGFGDTPAALLDDDTNITQRFFYLPGGVLVTINASSYRTWSYPDLNGHYITTTDNAGTRLSPISSYDPWGATVPGSIVVNNMNATTDLAAYGISGKLEEHATTQPLILMGARPFNPADARFIAVDPVQGGCANAYVYAYGDPLNVKDLTGKNACQDFYGYVPPAAYAAGLLQLVSVFSTAGLAVKAALFLARSAFNKVADVQSESRRGDVQAALGSTVVAPSGVFTRSDREILALGFAHGLLPYDLRVGSAYQIGQTQFQTDCWAGGLPYVGWKRTGQYE